MISIPSKKEFIEMRSPAIEEMVNNVLAEIKSNIETDGKSTVQIPLRGIPTSHHVKVIESIEEKIPSDWEVSVDQDHAGRVFLSVK